MFWRAPDAATCHRSPVVRKVEDVAVFTPERAFDLALGERSERRRLPAAIDIDDEEIGDAARSQTNAMRLPSGDQMGSDGCLISINCSIVSCELVGGSSSLRTRV